MNSKGCSAAGVIAATRRHQKFTTGCKLHSILPSNTARAWKASAITSKFLLAVCYLLQHWVPDFSE